MGHSSPSQLPPSRIRLPLPIGWCGFLLPQAETPKQPIQGPLHDYTSKAATMVGIDGMRFLNDLFGGIRGGCAMEGDSHCLLATVCSGGGADVPLFLLYELFTGTISVEAAACCKHDV